MVGVRPDRRQGAGPIDGGLRKLFQERIPEAHWVSVESWGITGRGIPDANVCLDGVEAWVEFKLARGWRIGLRPEQVAWLERRTRAGGRAFVAVRWRSPIASDRDELWLVPASQARIQRLPDVIGGWFWGGGPRRWDWQEVRQVIFGR